MNIPSTGAENVYKEIKHDLEEAGNLKAVFKDNPGLLGTIQGMSVNYVFARFMVYEKMVKYGPIQQQSLTLKPVPDRKLSIHSKPMEMQTEISVLLLLDKVCVLVFDR